MTTGKYAIYPALVSLVMHDEPVAQNAIMVSAQDLSDPPNTCRSDILDPALDVMMMNIMEQESKPDRSTSLASLNVADGVLRDALACMPTNSMVWARFAHVRWALGGSAQEQASLLTMSQTYSPAEIGPLAARIAQWERVSPTVRALGERALKADLEALLQHGSLPLIIEVMPSLPRSLHTAAVEAARTISKEKRDALVHEGLDLE
jgi:hypothetical protein